MNPLPEPLPEPLGLLRSYRCPKPLNPEQPFHVHNVGYIGGGENVRYMYCVRCRGILSWAPALPRQYGSNYYVMQPFVIDEVPW